MSRDGLTFYFHLCPGYKIIHSDYVENLNVIQVSKAHNNTKSCFSETAPSSKALRPPHCSTWSCSSACVCRSSSGLRVVWLLAPSGRPILRLLELSCSNVQAGGSGWADHTRRSTRHCEAGLSSRAGVPLQGTEIASLLGPIPFPDLLPPSP